jgi:hypothetical protein
LGGSSKRAEAYISGMYAILYIVQNKLNIARGYLNILREYKLTKEQGLRGNPDLLEAYIFIREKNIYRAEQLLRSCLKSVDNTIKAAALILLSKISCDPLTKEKYYAKAIGLSKRNGFPLYTSLPFEENLTHA